MSQHLPSRQRLSLYMTQYDDKGECRRMWSPSHAQKPESTPAFVLADRELMPDRLRSIFVASHASANHIPMPSLSLRIDLDPEGRIGPGKIELLENIASLGSIAAAGRAMGMSYRRAWMLVEEINQTFGQPVTMRQTGGRNGGGASLTPLGLAVVARYRAIERAVVAATQDHMTALQREVTQKRVPKAVSRRSSKT